MYAIIEAGGRQWKVEPGTRLEINRIAGEAGASYTVDRVLFAQDGQKVQVGAPYLPGATVVCEVVAHLRGPKVISYHFRRRENWRKTVGHRQQLTALLVKDIHVDGMTAAPAAARKTEASATRVKPAAGRTPTVKTASPKLPSRPTPMEKPKSAPKRATKE